MCRPTADRQAEHQAGPSDAADGERSDGTQAVPNKSSPCSITGRLYEDGDGPPSCGWLISLPFDLSNSTMGEVVAAFEKAYNEPSLIAQAAGRGYDSAGEIRAGPRTDPKLAALCADRELRRATYLLPLVKRRRRSASA